MRGSVPDGFRIQQGRALRRSARRVKTLQSPSQPFTRAETSIFPVFFCAQPASGRRSHGTREPSPHRQSTPNGGRCRRKGISASRPRVGRCAQEPSMNIATSGNHKKFLFSPELEKDRERVPVVAKQLTELTFRETPAVAVSAL